MALADRENRVLALVGLASMREVGLEIGNTIGLSTPALMISMTSLVNAPCAVDVPSRMVRRTCRTASAAWSCS